MQEFLQEANLLYSMMAKTNNQLLSFHGIHFDSKNQILQIYFPQKVSLYTILHSGNYQPLKSIEKQILAQKIARGLFTILKQSARGQQQLGDFAHSHLTSKNIFVNVSDMDVQIGDYGLFTLKKFCKLFNGYSNMLSKWSAPEIWEKHYCPVHNGGDD